MRKTVTVLILLTVLMASYIIIIRPAWASADSWTTKAQMPSTRTGFGVAVVNGKIYAIGGHPFGGVTTEINQEYDPATDKWISKKSMPNPLAWFGIAVYKNEIYVIGGAWFLVGTEENSVWVYNPATDAWNTSKTSMFTPRAGMQANVVDGKIYVIGGKNADGVTNVTEVYDPVTDMWATKKPVPTPVYSYASAVVDDKIYVIGGLTTVANSTAQSRIDLNQIYDPKTDTWRLGTPIPNTNGANAGATTGTMAPKRIYVIGGGLNQVYDPASDSWTNATPIPRTNRMENFDDVVVAVVNDQLYAIGGIYEGEDGSRYSVNDQYTPIGYIPEFPTWAPILFMLCIVAVVVVIYKRKLSGTRQLKCPSAY
jgi:N-acetylneuraminic acid mutarotase